MMGSTPSSRVTTSLYSSDGSADGFLELSNTLTRLDQQWRLQQRNRPTQRWTKLVLANPNEGTEAKEYAPETPVPPQMQDNMVYLLEPPNKSSPSCLIVFIGGAGKVFSNYLSLSLSLSLSFSPFGSSHGWSLFCFFLFAAIGLGTFPQIAYNEFLTRLSDRLNAAIITAPYQVGLDHFALSKTTGDLIRRAIIHCEEDPARLYSPTLPTYLIAHSLGCKLASIYMAATGQEFEGIGFISFNNFGFSNTIKLVRKFAEEIQKGTDFGSRRRIDSAALDGFFTFAENIMGSFNVDFSPSPSETERLLSLKYSPDRQRKTRLFVFDDDNMDSSASIVEALRKEGEDGGITLSGLPGNHLSPVYFQLGLNNLPEEARYVAGDSLGGLQNISYGSLDELTALVEEVANFILGRGPSRIRNEPLLASKDED
jgi:hypothetical protein